MKETSTIPHTPSIGRQSQTTETKRVAIYIRCSSDEAKKGGYSPETQEEKLRGFIKNNRWQLEERYIYKDIGYSGGVKERPALHRLLTDAKNKEFDIVLVFRLDRFFRKLRLLENVLTELLDSEIGVKSITEPWADYSNPSARLNVQILGAVAEWQREIGLGSRNEGMIKAMKAGKWLGGTPPYGYKFNKETQRLEIDEKEARIVKILYEWLANEGLSEYKIQQKINSMKIPTKYDRLGRKKKTGSKYWWNRRTIGRILRSEIYAGAFYYRRYKSPGRVRGKNNLRPKEEWIRVEDKSLKIISRELFEKAQQQLKKNKELSPRNTKQSYTLQHKIICGFDGYRYQCATRHYHSKKTGDSRKTKYYFCTGNRRYFSPKRCPAPTISESRILPPIWEKLKEILSNPERIMQELKGYLEQKSKKNQVQRQLNNIEGSLNSSNAKRERYAELYAEGSINKEFYARKIQECEKEIEGLQKEKEKLSHLFLTEEERQERMKSVKELYLQLKESLENATYEVKREVLQRLVGKIIKTGNNLDVEFNLPFTESSLKPAPVDCSNNRRMDCPHNHTKTFSIFVTTHVLPREEINREASTHQNFLNKDGTPKSKSRHKVKERYRIDYYRDKIVDGEIKRKFDEIREYLKKLNPSIQEEYTKRRLTYWASNRCLYTLEPRRKTLWIGTLGKRKLRGYRSYFDSNKTYFRLTRNSDIEKVLALL